MSRILVVTELSPDSDLDGATKLSKGVISALRANHRVDVISLFGGDEDAAHGIIASSPRRWRRLRQALSVLTAIPLHKAATQRLGAFRHLERAILRYKPDVIVFSHFRTAWLVNGLKEHIPSVYLAHNAEYVTTRSLSILSRNYAVRVALYVDSLKLAAAERSVIQKCHVSIALSTEDAARLTKLCPKSQILVIPPAVECRERLFVDFDRPISLLLLGSFLWPPKRDNAEWLIQKVFPIVRCAFPDVTLRVVGRGAACLSLAPDKTEGISISSDVADTTAYFRSADIFVVPEHQVGGIKMKTLEAAAYSLAIVSTGEGVEGTGLIDGESCLVARSASEFAQKISCLIRDAALRKKLGLAAQTLIRGEMSEEAAVIRYNSVIAGLCANIKTPCI